MLLEEIDIIRDLLIALQPERCLEWGAGYSTLYFPSFLPRDSHWLALEHVERWASRIQSRIRLPTVSVVHVAADSSAGEDTGGGKSYSEFRNYVEYPSTLEMYDFILIDGRARVPCLLKAITLLAPGGVVVLHDANRVRYLTGTVGYLYQFQLLGRGVDQLGIWIGSMTDPIETLLPTDKYLRLWDFYSRLATKFRRKAAASV